MKRLILLSLICLVGCKANYEKQKANFHLFAYNNPDELAKDCSRFFPLKDTIMTTFIPANNKDYTRQIDSLYTVIGWYANYIANLPKTPHNDSLKKATLPILNKATNLKKDYKPCIPDTAKSKSVEVDRAKETVLLAQIKGRNDSLVIVKTQLAQSNETAGTRLKWILYLAGGIGVLGLIKLGQLYLKFKGI